MLKLISSNGIYEDIFFNQIYNKFIDRGCEDHFNVLQKTTQ